MLTKKVAFATVVNLTAVIKVAKCKQSNAPDIITSKRSLPAKLVKLLLSYAKRAIATAAMANLKNVRERGGTSVAYLMRTALVPNEIEAIVRMQMPFEEYKVRTSVY